ncbi:RILP-like protein 2 [Taeniopygia guttata]|uniref:RILP-like protein 2 n=2 Tax=Estrildinae TaxID=40155 RepID=UPI003BB987AB
MPGQSRVGEPHPPLAYPGLRGPTFPRGRPGPSAPHRPARRDTALPAGRGRSAGPEEPQPLPPGSISAPFPTPGARQFPRPAPGAAEADVALRKGRCVHPPRCRFPGLPVSPPVAYRQRNAGGASSGEGAGREAERGRGRRHGSAGGGRGRSARGSAARPGGRERRGAAGMERGRDGEEELEEEDEDEEEDGGPESALEKSPFQLTAADVYDISSVVGRDLLQLHAGPQLPAARARLQFRIVRVLEMLEALVSESSVAEEQLRRERDSLRRELEQLRAAARGSAPQPSLGPDQMVIDLTDPNRPRFTLQELRDVLQERNQLKAQLLVVQEELQCYKSGIISQKRDQTEELEKEASGSSAGSRKDSEEKTIIKRLFSFKHGK